MPLRTHLRQTNEDCLPCSVTSCPPGAGGVAAPAASRAVLQAAEIASGRPCNCPPPPPVPELPHVGLSAAAPRPLPMAGVCGVCELPGVTAGPVDTATGTRRRVARMAMCVGTPRRRRHPPCLQLQEPPRCAQSHCSLPRSQPCDRLPPPRPPCAQAPPAAVAAVPAQAWVAGAAPQPWVSAPTGASMLAWRRRRLPRLSPAPSPPPCRNAPACPHLQCWSASARRPSAPPASW